jgi:hypothetical protein
MTNKPKLSVEHKIDCNIWDNIEDVLPILQKMKNDEWDWSRNTRCKYIELRIDMRDGGCIITDRDRIRINPEDLAYQHKYGSKGKS